MGIVLDARPAVGRDGLTAPARVMEPVVRDHRFPLRDASNHDGSDLRVDECVVAKLHPTAGRDGAVLAVSPAVHVKQMAVGVGQDDIVPGHIARRGAARAGDGVPVPVEQVVLDSHFGLIE